MDLKCRKTNCKFNDRYSCQAKGILVKDNLVCNTYNKRENLPEKQRQDVSRDMFEVAPDIHPFRHNKEVDIRCKANCLFNDNGNCKANGITVQNTKTSAICMTNIDK
jgi:hypothetical protein